MTPENHRMRLAAPAGLTPGGEFEILAITAGTGNGWQFPARVLQHSLPLWDGADCFVDHVGPQQPAHSLRDLGGHCSDPRWDEAAQGIRLRLQTGGPSGALVEALGREWLAAQAAGQPVPAVGFSADISFSAQNKEALEILRIHSVDLVAHPARGGAFVRALNAEAAASPHSNPSFPVEVHAMSVENSPTPETAAPVQQAQAVQQQMCACLLDSALAASRLPAPAVERVRRQFANRVFNPADLQTAIEDTRALVSELTGSLVVQGPGRIHSMFSSQDQLQAAVDDLLGAQRSPALSGLQTARLSGIRELYLMLTGDDDLHGGYYAERTRLATTADFTGLVKNALNKLVAERWAELGQAGYDWWQKIASVEHFNTLNQITGTLVGTVGDLPNVAEGAEYTELQIGDSAETASFVKYGGYIPLTLELIDRDDTRKLRAYPHELAVAGIRKISSLVAAVFTSNSGAGPSLSDGGALFNASAVTSAGGHANLGTTALSAAQWDAVCKAVYDQPMLIKNSVEERGKGPKMAINPRYLLVPRALQLSAMKIVYPTLENAANIYSENQQRGQPGDVITVPEWSDPTDWAAACDPRICPAIFVGERFGLLPEVFIASDSLSPAVFMNDEHRLKVRHFLAVWVNDFRPLHKSNVAG